ncbi:MAG: hypothetical protein AABX30_00135 [Nanoarchaeota archaeon]
MKIPKSLTNLLVGTGMLGIATAGAVGLGGCALNKPYIGERERKVVIKEMQDPSNKNEYEEVEGTKSLFNYKKLYHNITATPIEELKTPESTNWIKKDFINSLKYEEFKKIYIIYSEYKEKRNLNPYKLSEREKLELYHFNKGIKDISGCLGFYLSSPSN